MQTQLLDDRPVGLNLPLRIEYVGPDSPKYVHNVAGGQFTQALVKDCFGTVVTRFNEADAKIKARKFVTAVGWT